MTMHFEIDDAFIAEQNRKPKTEVAEDYDHLAADRHDYQAQLATGRTGVGYGAKYGHRNYDHRGLK